MMEEQDFFSDGSPMLCSPNTNAPQAWNGDLDDNMYHHGNIEMNHYQQKINQLERQLHEAQKRIIALQNQLLKKEKDAKQNKVNKNIKKS